MKSVRSKSLLFVLSLFLTVLLAANFQRNLLADELASNIQTNMAENATIAANYQLYLPLQMVNSTGSDTADPVLGQYIVVFNDDMSLSVASDVITEMVVNYDAEVAHVYTSALNGFAAKLNDDALTALSTNPMVAYIEQDRLVYLDNTQSNATWGLDRIDQKNLPLDTLYHYDYTGAGVNVYIIDSGIRMTHNEFGGRAFLGVDVIGDGQNGNDCLGHGTHVAGTAGGSTYGVAKEANLYAVRVFSCSGQSLASIVIAGVDWVTAHHSKPAVANMSLGGSVYPPLEQAVQNSIASGVTYVVAAGNKNQNACNYSPANVDEALTVGATDNRDHRALFYNWGSNWGPCVDIFAPGVQITAADYLFDSSLSVKSGTSMASPHVAGVAALYLEANPNASPADVFGAIIANATPNVLSNIGAGSPNLLLYSLLGDGNNPTFDCLNVTQIPQIECEALVALYESTSGDNWNDNTDWLATNTPCSWYGVKCQSGHVFQLWLHYNQLNGEIPAEIGNLPLLKNMYLEHNQLTGSIPPTIGNLTSLTQLYLYKNQLSGEIPAQIGNLSALYDLQLYDNQLSGAIPPTIGNLTSLTQLYLYKNQLSGAIPAQIGNLVALKHLYLSQNQLSGAIPPQIGNLSALTHLSLFHNQFSGTVPAQIGNLSALVHLGLYGNQLTAVSPAIGNLSNLQMLLLHQNNNLSGTIPTFLTNLTQLTHFTYSATQWCAPSTGPVADWLLTIPTVWHSGLSC